MTSRSLSKLAEVDRRVVQDLTSSLRHVVLGGGPALRALADPLRDALRAFCAGGFGFQMTTEGLRCAFVHAQLGDDVRTDLDRSLEAASAGRWANYDPMSPAARDRNVAKTIAPRDANGTGIRQVLVKHGLVTHHARILVCDGPHLLAWVGGFRDEPMGDREVAILQALADPLRDRLLLERTLESADLTARVLDAAMDRFGAVAFVVGAHGRILHANAAGRTRLAAEGAAGARRVAAAVTSADPMFDAHPIVGDGQPREFLVIGRASGGNPRDRVTHAAKHWGLTPRQCDVLELLVGGHGNAHIAAALRISIRTVEVHVSAIFDRAGCDSRASLIALLLS